jgi:hypothetical protein
LVVVLAGFLSPFLIPRSVNVESASGSSSGLHVWIYAPDGEHTGITDDAGVVRFGRGRWTGLFGKTRPITFPVQRGSELLRSGHVEAPRWGPLRISTQ